MTAIALHDISQRFAATWALAQVRITIPRGATVALLGPNGCGKSTLLRILAGRLIPTSGSGTILGWQMGRQTGQIRERVQWLGHDLGLYRTLSAHENLRWAFHLEGARACRQSIDRVLTAVGLDQVRHDPVAGFSSGMRKRLALARLLLKSSDIFLLDEPHANLDRAGQALMNDCIRRWKTEGRTTIFASHDASEAIALADCVCCLERGRVRYCGAPDGLPSEVV